MSVLIGFHCIRLSVDFFWKLRWQKSSEWGPISCSKEVPRKIWLPHLRDVVEVRPSQLYAATTLCLTCNIVFFFLIIYCFFSYIYRTCRRYFLLIWWGRLRTSKYRHVLKNRFFLFSGNVRNILPPREGRKNAKVNLKRKFEFEFARDFFLRPQNCCPHASTAPWYPNYKNNN